MTRFDHFSFSFSFFHFFMRYLPVVWGCGQKGSRINTARGNMGKASSVSLCSSPPLIMPPCLQRNYCHIRHLLERHMLWSYWWDGEILAFIMLQFMGATGKFFGHIKGWPRLRAATKRGTAVNLNPVMLIPGWLQQHVQWSLYFMTLYFRTFNVTFIIMWGDWSLTVR